MNILSATYYNTLNSVAVHFCVLAFNSMQCLPYSYIVLLWIVTSLADNTSIFLLKLQDQTIFGKR